jgi:hypothetical protein
MSLSSKWLLVCLLAAPAMAQGEQPRADAREAAPPAFPLRVSESRRYLEDQQGRPFLVVGDTPWSLIVDLKEDDIRHYLDDRQRRGFNALIVNLIEHKFATDPPRTRAGIEPLLRDGDFSTPNPKYFDFAHEVIAWAGERGMAVWLCPAYLGWGGGDEGFFREIDAGGVKKLQAYGRYVGDRFRNLHNIVWMIGGDYAVPKEHAWTITVLAEALRAGGARQPMTVHGGQQSAIDVVGEQAWIDINNTYSYDNNIFWAFRRDFERKPIRPFVLIESTYENEHGAPPERIRRQAYWAMTCGGCGQFFGNNPIWHFDGPGLHAAPYGWREALDGTGSRDMSRLRKAFADRPWHLLIPDFAGKVVTHGGGSGEATIRAAATSDGKLAMIYIPSTGREARKFTVDAARLASPATGQWFNPTDGRYQPIAEKLAPRPIELTTPGDNGTKTNDWLLVLEAGR